MPEPTVNEMWTALKRFKERYNNLPVALKMSRETMRKACSEFNIQIGKVTSVFGMPIHYDESIPFGTFEEVFAPEDFGGGEIFLR